MITFEEALIEAKNRINVISYTDYINRVIESLEKQVPKRPFRVIINGELDDELCPTCNSLHIADNYHGVRYNHCPDCGQKLDWSEV